MLKLPVRVPVFRYDEDEVDYKALGIDRPEKPLAECETRDIIFWSIAGVGVHIDNKIEYGTILSNGYEFISPLSQEKLNDFIQKQK